MSSSIDINALGQALDTSWGRSSTPLQASSSVKFKLLNDTQIIANYAAIVNFRTNLQYTSVKNQYSKEAALITKAALDNVKKIYKELTGGKTLKLKEISFDEDINVINIAVHTSNKTAHFKRTAFIEVS